MSIVVSEVGGIMNLWTGEVNMIKGRGSTNLPRLRNFNSRDQNVVKPQHPTLHNECLFLQLIGEKFPPPGRRAVMCKTASTSDGDEPPVCADGRVSDRPVRCEVALKDLRGNREEGREVELR